MTGNDDYVDPKVCVVEDFCPGLDPELPAQARDRAVEHAMKIPPRYRNRASVTVPAVRSWVVDRVRDACRQFTVAPSVTSGGSLLLLGNVGRGKTHQAFGAFRAFGASGARCRWAAVSAPNLYAQLRPRQGVDSEAVFQQYAGAPLLLLDDVGAEKSSMWVEEVNARIVDYRWEQELPTIFTTNCTHPQLQEHLGARVMSRLEGMTTLVQLSGPDRRQQP